MKGIYRFLLHSSDKIQNVAAQLNNDKENYGDKTNYDDEENYDDDENYDDKEQRRLAFRQKCLGARLRVKAMQILSDITSN